MTVDSEAIFALVDADGPTRRGARGALRLDGRGLARRARCATRSSSRAASDGRSGSAKARARPFSRPRRTRSRSSSATSGVRLRKRELPEGILLSLGEGRRHRSRPVHAGPRFRGDAAAGRARASRGRFLPAPPRRDRGCLSAALRRHLHPILAQPLAHEELERRPRTSARRLEHAGRPAIRSASR